MVLQVKKSWFKTGRRKQHWRIAWYDSQLLLVWENPHMTAAYIPTYYIPQIPEDESNSRKRTFSFPIQWIYTADVFPLPDECFALGASTFFSNWISTRSNKAYRLSHSPANTQESWPSNQSMKEWFILIFHHYFSDFLRCHLGSYHTPLNSMLVSVENWASTIFTHKLTTPPSFLPFLAVPTNAKD